MVEVEQGQELVPVWATDAEWRKVAACVAACASRSAQFTDDNPHELNQLWLRIHPEGEV